VGSTPCETGAFATLDKPINPLRQRMIDDMTARRFKEKVQKDYAGTSEASRPSSAGRRTRR
jgi:hypothetical protein